MKSLTDMKPALLEWRMEGGLPMSFKLCAEDGIAAVLVFPDRLDTLARVETAEGSWTLKHLGVLNPVVTLREDGKKTNLAVFHPHAFRHGKLEFADGAVFDWTTLHDDEPGGAFLDIEGMPMVRLHARPPLKPLVRAGLESGMVELGQAPKARWRHGVLAAIGWYLLLIDQLKEHPEHAAEASLMM
jgi:hypothetical protein